LIGQSSQRQPRWIRFSFVRRNLDRVLFTNIPPTFYQPDHTQGVSSESQRRTTPNRRAHLKVLAFQSHFDLDFLVIYSTPSIVTILTNSSLFFISTPTSTCKPKGLGSPFVQRSRGQQRGPVDDWSGNTKSQLMSMTSKDSSCVTMRKPRGLTVDACKLLEYLGTSEPGRLEGSPW
jgi:hypothetical protein